MNIIKSISLFLGILIYIIIWFLVVINLFSSIHHLWLFIILIVGMLVDVDGDKKNPEIDLKLESNLSRILYSVIIVGLIINSFFVDVSINQFILVLLGVYYSSRIYMSIRFNKEKTRVF